MRGKGKEQQRERELTVEGSRKKLRAEGEAKKLRASRRRRLQRSSREEGAFQQWNR